MEVCGGLRCVLAISHRAAAPGAKAGSQGPSVGQLAVVVLVGRAAQLPAARAELQHLQQQQAGHGADGLLQQEAVPQQVEEVVHALAVQLLQLVPDAVQLQHQAVHLGSGGRMTRLGSKLTFYFSMSKNTQTHVC